MIISLFWMVWIKMKLQYLASDQSKLYTDSLKNVLNVSDYVVNAA
jgi:hypothetical protein